MGGTITELNQGTIGKADRDTDSADRATADRASGGSTSTASSTGDGNGTGELRGRSDGTNDDEREEKVPRLVTVSDEEQKRQERNAKRRERYARQKQANGGTVKPRKVNSTKKTEPQFTTEQLDTFIVTLSAVVASRPNCEQWMLTKEEVQSITTPLMGILKDTEKLEIVTQNSNQIALVFACITVFAPRIFVTLQKQKAEREKVNNAKRKVTETKTDSQKSDRPNDRKPTSDGTGNGGILSVYGSPVS